MSAKNVTTKFEGEGLNGRTTKQRNFFAVSFNYPVKKAYSFAKTEQKTNKTT